MRGDGDGDVLVLAPMPLELRAFVRAAGLTRGAPLAGRGARRGVVGGRSVTALATGIGTGLAAATARDALDGAGPAHVLVVGIAGAIPPHHAVGQRVDPVVVRDAGTGADFHPHVFGDDASARAGALLTGDELIRSPERLASLSREGVTALDMETAAIAAACEGRGVPWSVVRAISDLAGDDQVGATVDGGLARADGRPDLGAVARYLARGPWRIRGLARLAGQAQRAAGVAAEEAVRRIERSR